LALGMNELSPNLTGITSSIGVFFPGIANFAPNVTGVTVNPTELQLI
jgi:hypothetical protein